MEPLIKEIACIVRSPARVKILQKFNERGTVDRRELQSELDVSRTTCTRNLEALEEQGWITRTADSYRITPCGALVAENLLELVDTTEAAKHLQPVLKWLDISDLDVELRHLADAEVTLPEPADPYAPVTKHVEALEVATTVRVLLPQVGRDAADVCRRRATDGNGEFELVVTPRVADQLRENSSYADFVETARTTDRITILVAEGSTPFYLGLLDETVQIGVSDDSGMPRGLLEVDSDPVRDWAREMYSDYRDGASPLIDKMPT